MELLEQQDHSGSEIKQMDSIIKDFDQKIQLLLGENQKLNDIIENQQAQLSAGGQSSDLDDKIKKIVQENEKLVHIINEKEGSIM